AITHKAYRLLPLFRSLAAEIFPGDFRRQRPQIIGEGQQQEHQGLKSAGVRQRNTLSPVALELPRTMDEVLDLPATEDIFRRDRGVNFLRQRQVSPAALARG